MAHHYQGSSLHSLNSLQSSKSAESLHMASGQSVADAVIHDLLLKCQDQSLMILEHKCKAYLKESAKSSPLLLRVVEEHEKGKASRQNSRREKKFMDIIQDTFDIHSVKKYLDDNHRARFSVASSTSIGADDSSNGFQGYPSGISEYSSRGGGSGALDRGSVTSTSSSTTSSSSPSSASPKSDYEDVVDSDVLSAPICDICIVQKGQPTPRGYYRISRTTGNKKANLNTGSGGDILYICIKKIKKDEKGDAVPITSIVMFYPDQGEYLPPGFQVVRMDNTPCNLAAGTRTEYSEKIFLAFKRIKGGNPVVDIQVILPDKGEEVPAGFNLLTHSPTGFPANFNFGCGAPPILLCYRQCLPKLECLLKDVIDLCDMPQTKKRSPSAANNNFVDGSVASRSGSVDYSTEVHFDEARSEDASHLSSKGESEFDEILSLENDEIAALNKRIASKSAVLCEEGILVPKLSRSALFTILSGLYTRDENVSIIAINGLIKLLKETDFYGNDIKSSLKARYLTLLDMTLDALCDRFDVCSEQEFDAMLEFFRILIKRSNGSISCSTLQRIYRTITFLSQYYSSKTNWFSSDEQMPTAEGGIELPVFKVMRELIKACHIQVEQPRMATNLPSGHDSSNNSLASFSTGDNNISVSIPLITSSPPSSNNNNSNSNFASPGGGVTSAEPPLVELKESLLIVKDIFRELVDNVVECVELHRISEHLLLVINKQHVTISSSAFWEEINSISKKLFRDPVYRSAFLVLAAICKSSWLALPGNISTTTVLANTHSGREKSRELGSKLLALEALHEFCFWAGEKLHESKVMGYLIRRLVVPCLLFNVNYAFSDVRIFSKLLKIFTALWKVWRVHIRLEFAILCENLVIRVLNAGQNAKPIYQMLVIQEVVTWFDQPYLMIEMFVNYDMDYKFVSNWNIFSHLVRSICGIARKATANYRLSRDLSSTNPSEVTSDAVNMLALEQACRISKTLMDASGHAHLIKTNSNFRARNVSYGGGWAASDDGSGGVSPEIVDSSSSSAAAPTREGRRKSVVAAKRDLHEVAESLIQQAIRIYKEKESIKKAINFLVAKDFITDTPQEIASFLRVYKNSFDPTAIGDFLGEGGVKPSEIEYFNLIRYRYIRVVSFLDMSLEPALRLFLTGCGFRLPGEAQKIDRLVEIFVKIFWQDNRGSVYCPFHNEDPIHIVAFAIIMLNTDLHRANADHKKGKLYKKMTKEQFIKNLRGINNGDDVEREYLSNIYDNIAEKPIELAFDASERLKVVHQPKEDPRRFSTLGGVANFLNFQTAEINKEGMDEKSFILEVTRGLRDSEDLLRSLSVYNYDFQLTGAEDGSANISLDLVSFMYETVWFHFQSVTESLLSVNTTDVHILSCALDISSHSISSALCLDLVEGKEKLASLLANFQIAVTKSESYKRIADKVPIDNTWQIAVKTSSPENAMEVTTKVHKMVHNMKVALQYIRTYDELFQIASRTDKKEEILKNNTKFLYEGDLQKKNRSGGTAVYRFLLFSNCIIYAHTSITGEFKVHQSLNLDSVFVTDPRKEECSFILNHPHKSFILMAVSMDSKYQWLRVIGEAKDDLRWTQQQAANTNK